MRIYVGYTVRFDTEIEVDDEFMRLKEEGDGGTFELEQKFRDLIFASIPRHEGALAQDVDCVYDMADDEEMLI